MRGREFLDVAQELLSTGKLPRHWRAVVIHAYYALLLECRDTMARWGIPAPARTQIHAQVRLRLIYATHAELKQIGFALEELGLHRNSASYDLSALPLFATAALARLDASRTASAIALLDAIDADPARRAGALAAIKP